MRPALPSALRRAALVAVAMCLAASAAADEGLWPLDSFPSARVGALHGFAPDRAWLDRVQRNSVRLENGCSGAVVSRDGAMLTNQHCITDCLSDLSSPRVDLLAGGFVARSRADERICPGLEVSILAEVTDVSSRMQSAGAAGRASVAASVEAEACGENPARRCEVVLQSGRSWRLYRYDRYTDVRLAFAPEIQAAAFGGDADNFSFPRHAFDVAVLRIYRDGQPAAFADPLKVASRAPAPGELVFAAGHPGYTQRTQTMAQLERLRDHDLPMLVEHLAQLRGSLITEAGKGEEEARQVAEYLKLIENSVKSYRGQRQALVNPAFMSARMASEIDLRDALASDADLRRRHGDPFADLERAIAAHPAVFAPYQMLEWRFGAGSVLLHDARTLVRAASERERPIDARLPEFADNRIPAMEGSLLAQGAVHPVLERIQIEFWLDKTREVLGADHPAVQAMFGSRTAAQIASDVVTRSQLVDPAVRARLWRNPAEIARSTDPAIALVRSMDATARAARQAYDEGVGRMIADASARLAALRADVLGSEAYPEADFTLRLSFGVVRGWVDPVSGPVAPYTDLDGLMRRVSGSWPLTLAPRWQAARSSLPSDIRFNFVADTDAVGGSSGAPMLDRAGEVVGIAFDGNIHATGGAFGFDPALNRTVSLASPLILEALRVVYGANALADELLVR